MYKSSMLFIHISKRPQWNVLPENTQYTDDFHKHVNKHYYNGVQPDTVGYSYHNLTYMDL